MEAMGPKSLFSLHVEKVRQSLRGPAGRSEACADTKLPMCHISHEDTALGATSQFRWVMVTEIERVSKHPKDQ